VVLLVNNDSTAQNANTTCAKQPTWKMALYTSVPKRYYLFFFIRFATRLKKEGNDTPEKLPLSLFFPCGNPFSLVSLYLSGSLFFPFIDPYTYVCMYMYIHGRIAYKNCPCHLFFFWERLWDSSVGW